MAQKFTPPEPVQQAARRGMELRKQHDHRTLIGVTLARELASGTAITLDAVGRMAAYFSRHDTAEERAARAHESTSMLSIAWLLWGGDAGRQWAADIWDGRKVEKSEMNVHLLKADDEQRVVSLILSVAEEPDGTSVRDAHGHVIDAEELQRCAWEYMRSHRLVGIGHDILDEHGYVVGKSHGTCLGSYVLTRTVQKGLRELWGLPDGALPVVWLVDLHIPQDDDWQWVKEHGAMGSLGGEGMLEAVDD
jgi:hypothetical protein